MRNFVLVTLVSLLLAACGVNDSVRITAPALVAVFPATGTPDVDVATTLWAEFDSSVDASWLAGSFSLTDADGATIVVSMSYDAATHRATFTPSQPLSFGTVYVAAIEAGVSTQSAAAVLAEDAEWTFTTVMAPESTDPGNDPGGNPGTDSDSDPVTDPGTDPGSDDPVSDGPGTDEPGTDDPGTDEPGTDDPATDDPDYDPGTGDTGSGEPIDACDENDNCTKSNLTVDLIRVNIPAGATWTLHNVTILGTLTVGPGATLYATNILVRGNFEADLAEHVELIDSRVTGNLSIHNGGSATLDGTALEGNAEFIGNAGDVRLDANHFDRNVTVDENMVVLIDANSVGGSLGCAYNAPAPSGAGNTANVFAGQCIGLD